MRSGQVVMDGGELARAADHGAVRPKAFGFGIASTEDAVVDAAALVAGDKFPVADEDGGESGTGIGRNGSGEIGHPLACTYS